MSVADYILLFIIIGYTAYIIFGKKKKGCCGDCSACRRNCR